jgi:hypothetical protein
VKRILSFLFVIIFTTSALATGIGATDTTASCDNNTLGQTSGTANVEIDWQPNTINISWYSDSTQLNVQSSAQSCVYDDDLYLPTTQPTKTGYTFKGWKLSVPSGYTRLDYIETTGTQYIDTDYVWTSQNRKVDMDFMITQYRASSHPFGSTNNAHYDLNPYFGSANSAMGNWIGQNHFLDNNIVKDIKHNVVWNLKSNKSFNLIIDGTDMGTTNVTTIPTTGSSVYLFHVHLVDDARTYYPLIGKLYATKMWDDGVLVRDMIPAMRNSDGAIGMWDSASEQFYTNAGSGTFGYKINLPNGYTRLEYIETTGTQYIDTGYVWTSQNRKVDMDFMLTEYTNQSHLLGSTLNYTYDLNPYFYTTNDMRNYIGGTSYIPKSITKDSKYNVIWDLKSDKSFNLVINGTNQGTTTVAEIPTSGASVYLFHVHLINHSLSYTPLVGRLYATKMWDNGTRVRDLIPAKNSSNVVGLYDFVTGQFFTNAGTGTFVAGPVVQ